MKTLSPAYLATVQYPAQAVAINALENVGFRFTNWIRSDVSYSGEDESAQCAVMTRRNSSFSHSHCEVETDGACNGQTVETFIANNPRKR